MGTVDTPALGGLTRLLGWPCFASLQSMDCSHVVQPLALAPCSQCRAGRYSLEWTENAELTPCSQRQACNAAYGGDWGRGSDPPCTVMSPVLSACVLGRWPHCIVYSLHVSWLRYHPHASQSCYCPLHPWGSLASLRDPVDSVLSQCSTASSNWLVQRSGARSDVCSAVRFPWNLEASACKADLDSPTA